MVRPSDFSDPEYDRQLAEFKAKKAEMLKERGVKPKSEASASIRSSSASTNTSARSSNANNRRQ